MTLPSSAKRGLTMTVSQLLATVSFADDAGNDESLTSAGTAAVVLGGL